MSQQQVPIPQTSHVGIIEHFARTSTFYNAAANAGDEQTSFRFLMAAMYSCQAMTELMLEQAQDGELTVNRDDLKDLLADKLPYFSLVERLRIQDFHRKGLMPPVPGFNIIEALGPIKLKVRKGGATVMQSHEGRQLVTTGQSKIEEQRPVYRKNDSYLDDKTNQYVPLRKIILDYVMAIPAAVEEYEKLVKPSAASQGQTDGITTTVGVGPVVPP